MLPVLRNRINDLSTLRNTRNEFSRFFDEFDKIFDHMLKDQGMPLFNGTGADPGFIPSIDVLSYKDKIEVSLDVPGLSKEDVNVSVIENQLIIEGERKHDTQTKDEKGNVEIRERFFGRFERRFDLPEGTEFEKINAKHENGVLKITIPFKEKIKQEEKKQRILIE